MIKTLYETFQHWSDKGSVWLYSDPHFDDNESEDYGWIPTEERIKRINAKVHKNDTLICLGDCGNIERFKELKCKYKVLIMGNHDDHGIHYYMNRKITEIYSVDEYSAKEVRQILSEKYPNCNIEIVEQMDFHEPFHYWLGIVDLGLFKEVYSGPLFISDKILLSHEPVIGLYYCLNIHSHSHQGQYEWTDIFDGKHLNNKTGAQSPSSTK